PRRRRPALAALPPEKDWPADPGDLSRPRPDRPFRGPCLRGARHDEADFEDLTLPRTLLDGCRFHGVSFRNSDLRLSCLAACELIDCDLSDAVLICADLRPSSFVA